MHKNPAKRGRHRIPVSPFFTLSADLLCIAGFDGYFKRINPAFRDLLGYSEQELLERPVNSFVHPDDRSKTEAARNGIRTGDPLLNFENRYITKAGKTVWLSWTSMPLGEEKLVYAIAKNITLQKERELKKDQILEHLTRTNERLKNLNYTTSHDLRSPAGNLLTILDFIDPCKIPDGDTREYIELLRMSAVDLKKKLDRQTDLILESRNHTVPVGTIHLPDVLDRITISIQVLIRESGTRITQNFGAFKEVTFNEWYLESVLLNLITNAIKYAHPDREPEIRITAQVNNGQKLIRIEDNGKGFDPAETGNIFGLGHTLQRNADSKGVGLYLTYTHMTSLGGNISADSCKGRGTTFTLTFPPEHTL